MITDDTILERLRWRRFDRIGESFRIAADKCNAILKYIFEEYTDTNFFEKDGIEIKTRGGEGWFDGVKMEFFDRFERRKFWRIVKFEGTAQAFKVRVLGKFELLKSLKQKAEEKYINQKRQEVAIKLEITELTEIAKRKFSKNPYGIQPTIRGKTHLTLDINFDSKQDLIDYINNF